MKKLINDPQDVMRESLAGFAAAHSDILKVSFDPVYVVRADAPVTGKVGIISGGGSGHEPLHGGFVGKGHARCRLSRPGLHFPQSRPDGSGHRAPSMAEPASSTSSRTTPATS